MRQPPPPLRTYSHLGDRQEVPSEYQIVSSRLLYHPTRGFEIDVPVAAFYARHQRDGQLKGTDWEAFADPRETTYSSYTRLEAGHEQHLDALARSLSLTGHDARLDQAWQARVGALLPPLRFAFHGLQMIASYLGQMAPSGRLTLVALFQAADELRRIHRIAQRMGELRSLMPSFGETAREDWQAQPAWQPLRRAVEEALVAYDWGESFVALCLGLKPWLDELILAEFGTLATQAGDFYLGEVLSSFAEDARWHREWAAAFVALAVREHEGNRAVLAAWLARWTAAGRAAAQGLGPLLGPEGQSAFSRSEARVGQWLGRLGLNQP